MELGDWAVAAADPDGRALLHGTQVLGQADLGLVDVDLLHDPEIDEVAEPLQ
jgi:hypothetical protein